MDKNYIYKKANLNNRLGFGKKNAVLVIDLIKGFTEKCYPLGCDLKNVIEATNKIIGISREKEIPVIFAVISYNPNTLDGGIWIRKAPAQGEFVEGSELVKIDPRVDFQPDKDTVLIKKYASCFFGTSLASTLNALRIDTLVLTGVSTSGCVRATAVDAMQYGFIPVIPREAVGDRVSEPHEASLFDIDAKYGDVVSLEETIGRLKSC